jgi:UDP-N-acetylmuramoyl-tripeptide--D-alanyl-D-alanine ligase
VNRSCGTLATVTDPHRQARGTDGPPPAFRAADLARLTGGRLLLESSRPIRGAAVDSRLVRPGNLFVALPGERTDGHRYLADAVAAGAAALVVSGPPGAPGDLASLGDVTILRVPDPLAALHALAASWRTRFDPLVVGVTGSIAKTSTKEAIAAVLARRFVTLRNEGNLNNEIGLPLTVLRLGPEHAAAVLEMGMYVGGEIADLARIARPRIGVVTAVQPVHLERIGTLDAVEAAKGELVQALPDDGVAILNADDPRVARMGRLTAARVRTYGFGTNADVTAERVEPAGTAGMRFVLRAGGRRLPVGTPALGRHAVHNALAAAAVGIEAGLALDEIAAGIADGWSAPHRSELIEVGGVLLLDDTYNASPGSMAAALELLATLPGRRVAVLGEMLELGDEHVAGHRAVGEAAARVVELLVVIGSGAEGIAEGARAAGLDPKRVIRVPDPDAALDLLRPRIRPGDAVLVKGSRGAALDVLVDRLREELA